MGKSKYTKEVFEMLGKAIHGENAFDYSEVIYVNSKTPVKLTCNSCGREFYQIPASHLRGRGCASCSHSGSSWTLDAFVEAARKVHGDKYQYHTIENFRGLFYKVSIFCPKHGVFEQLPDAHLRGQGCPHCWNEKRRNFRVWCWNKRLQREYTTKRNAFAVIRHMAIYDKTLL